MRSQKKAGIILSYASQAIELLTALLFTPIMLRLLGQTEFGLYKAVNSVVSYLGLLTFGFTSAYIRYFSMAKKEGEEKVRQINGMFMIIFLVMSLLCLVCGGVMLANIEGIFGNGLNAEEYARGRIMLVIAVIGMAIAFPTHVFNCNMNAREKFGTYRLFDCIQCLLNPFLSLPLLLMGYGSIGRIAVISGLQVVRMFVSWFYCRKVLKMEFSFKSFDMGLFKNMSVFTFFLFLNQMIEQLNWNLGNILVTRYRGLKEAAVYGVGSQIYTLFVYLGCAITIVFIPEVNRLIVVEKCTDEKKSEIFIRIGRVIFIAIWLVFSGFVLFGREFIALWTRSSGGDYAGAYLVAVIIMGVMLVPLIQNIGVEILKAENKHKVRALVFLGLEAVNIALSIMFIKLYGAVGAAMGLGISLILGNWFFINVYFRKSDNLDVGGFWKNILHFLPAVLIAIAAGIGLRFLIPATGWLRLGADILIYCAVYFAAMWFLGFNAYEKNLCTHFLDRFRKKQV